MIKRITLIVLAMLIVASTYYMIRSNNSNAQNNIEVDISDSDVEVYFGVLVDILSSNSIDELDSSSIELMTESMINDLDIIYTRKEVGSFYNKPPEEDIGDSDNIELENEIDKYPIIDQYGTVYRYGTLDESEKSYQYFNSLPNYTMINSSIQENTLRIKVFIREHRIIKSYLLVLNNDKKVDSYKVL